MDVLLFTVWFFAPAGFANTAPVLANNISQLTSFNKPLDFGRSFRGKRIFGDNKTFRGLFSGIILGALVGAVQLLLYLNIDWINTFTRGIDYGSFYAILLGAALGFGALAGDAIVSFFKRQLSIAPGDSWPVFDQIDLMAGAVIVSLLFTIQPWNVYVLAFGLILLIHPIANIISWLLGLQKKPI